MRHTYRAREGMHPSPFLQHPLRFSTLCLGELCGNDDKAQVDHEEGTDLESYDYALLVTGISGYLSDGTTHNNEKDEVDPIPERVSILDVVHDVRPALQRDHEEDGDPCEADVVERDGALEGVLVHHAALVVVDVPVDARLVVHFVELLQRQVASKQPGVPACWRSKPYFIPFCE